MQKELDLKDNINVKSLKDTLKEGFIFKGKNSGQIKLECSEKQGLLCSNPYKDNYDSFKNEGNFKGFYQNQTKEALQNSDLERAFSVVNEYIQKSKDNFYRFFNPETGKIHIAKQLNRFDAGYIENIKRQLKGIKNIGTTDILHIVLTLKHSEDKDYINQFELLKSAFNDFITRFKRIMRVGKILYFVSYECKKGSDGLYHQHLHLLIFSFGFIPKKALLSLKNYWHKLTGSDYIFFKYISKDRNHRAFDYALKYVLKEVGNLSLTAVLLFSVKGKAYTMSRALNDIMKVDNITQVKGLKLKYINTFKTTDIFKGYNPSDYDDCNLTWFLSLISDMDKQIILRQLSEQERAKIEQKEKEQAEAKERAEWFKTYTIKI